MLSSLPDGWLRSILTKTGVTNKRQTDVITALRADELCDLLVDVDGWAYDEYDERLSGIFASILGLGLR